MKGWGRGEGDEKSNVGVNNFSATINFAPIRSRPGAFLSERDKHIRRALSDDRKRFNRSRASIGSSDVSAQFFDRFWRKAIENPSYKTARFCRAGMFDRPLDQWSAKSSPRAKCGPPQH